MRIKKTSQYIEGGAGLPSYFTTETNTGMKWIDGKDIYRKVINTTIDLRTSGDHTIDAGLSNVSELIDLQYRLITGNRKLVFNSAINAIGLNSSNQIFMYTGVAWDNNMDFNFIITYTKSS